MDSSLTKIDSADPYATLLELLRQYQRKGKFVDSVYESPLSPAEAFVLIELDAAPSKTIGELGRILELQQSSASRVVTKLARHGYLKKSQASRDRRQSALSIGAKGREFLKHRNQAVNQFISSMVKNVDMSELAEIQRCLKVLADGDNAPQISLHPGDHPLVLEIRRLTYAHGIIKGDYVDSGYTPLEWQLLSAISSGERKIRACDLAEQFSIVVNTLSDKLHRMEKQGLLERKRLESDRRNFSLSLSKKGESVLRAIEDKAKSRMKRALSSLSSAEISNFLNLFAKYVGEPSIYGTSALPKNVSIRPVVSEHERAEGRAFVVLELVRKNLFADTPEILLGIDSICFGIYQSGALSGVIEFQNTGQTWVLRLSLLTAELEGGDTGKAILRHALALFFEKTGCHEVGVHSSLQTALSALCPERGKGSDKSVSNKIYRDELSAPQR